MRDNSYYYVFGDASTFSFEGDYLLSYDKLVWLYDYTLKPMSQISKFSQSPTILLNVKNSYS